MAEIDGGLGIHYHGRLDPWRFHSLRCQSLETGLLQLVHFRG
jgi:hypothetical protein